MKPRETGRRQISIQQTEIDLYLDPEIFWFQGHFPIQPLLPGVAQLDWVMHYANTLIAPHYRFHSIQNVKFQAPLLPENQVTLKLSWQEELQLLAFQFLRIDQHGQQHPSSSGKIRLCR